MIFQSGSSGVDEKSAPRQQFSGGRGGRREQTESFVNGVPSLLLIKSCPRGGETHLSWLFYSSVSAPGSANAEPHFSSQDENRTL